MAHVITARFVGKDGSLGYKHGQIYQLVIEGNRIIRPIPCPYESIEAFLNNWTF